MTLGLPVAGAGAAGTGTGAGTVGLVGISRGDFAGDTADELMGVFIWPDVATGVFCCGEGADKDG